MEQANNLTQEVQQPTKEQVVQESPQSIDIILPRLCPYDQVELIWDETGELSGLGEPCWYCTECGYIDA
jgi:hypothetical protein